MLIGYSFWGFLGSGVTDSPDGGRSHRRTLIDAIAECGHDIVFLQPDRDFLEAGQRIEGPFSWNSGWPRIDALFLEWRWQIEGRNTTVCGSPGHTCDLHRQQELLDAYTERGVLTVVWDKDLQLPVHDRLRLPSNVVILEAALYPTAGASTLLFPVDDDAMDSVNPTALAARERDFELCYIGNQYGRDDAFDEFFAPAAETLRHVVAGKWADPMPHWKHVNFIDRIPFARVTPLYQRSLATVCLLPERYRQAGQMTQRLFEAVMAGCLPIVPTSIAGHDRFVPPDLLVQNAADIVDTVHSLSSIAGTDRHRDLIQACIQRLDPFRVSTQVRALDKILTERIGRHPRGTTSVTNGVA